MNNSFANISALIVKHVVKEGSHWNWQAISACVSAFAVLAALSITFLSDRLRRRPNKTDLKFENFEIYEQGTGYIGRLIIKNHSRNLAASVEASVVSIIEDGKTRDGFLPVPLYWTHILDTTQRNIQGNQTVYLDLLGYTKGELYLHLQTLFSIRKTGLENFFIICNQKITDKQLSDAYDAACKGTPVNGPKEARATELKIRLYQENGQIVETYMDINWDGKDMPKISISNQ